MAAPDDAVFAGRILGQICECFLGREIAIRGRHAVIEDKPEYRKNHGVFYTPTYVVEYIVDHPEAAPRREVDQPGARHRGRGPVVRCSTRPCRQSSSNRAELHSRAAKYYDPLVSGAESVWEDLSRWKNRPSPWPSVDDFVHFLKSIVASVVG